MTGEIPLSAVPKKRIIGWLVMAAVTVVGIVLYFLYGDFVTPILVHLDPVPATLASLRTPEA